MCQWLHQRRTERNIHRLTTSSRQLKRERSYREREMNWTARSEKQREKLGEREREREVGSAVCNR